MSRQNNRFGGDPSGEPEWMKEFARGGDPGVHREEVSWPMKGLAKYNAAMGGSGLMRPRQQSGHHGLSPLAKRRMASGKASTKRPEIRQKERKGSGCGCRGEGTCQSNSKAASPRKAGPPKSRQVASSRPPVPTSTGHPAVEDLIAHLQKVLSGDGIELTSTVLTDVVTKALATARAATGEP